MVSVSTQTQPLSVPVVFGAQPIPVWCSHCNKMVTTFIEYESGDYAMFMSCCVTPWAMCADSVKGKTFIAKNAFPIRLMELFKKKLIVC
uniref:LITAF domain-containing protein n=1 Tax=Acrobeloides nanus TaxID=290746 RepID=A0A914E2N1_9BILA